MPAVANGDRSAAVGSPRAPPHRREGGFGGGGQGFDDAGGFGDILGNLFGGGFNRRGRGRAGTAGPVRGSDLETELHLDFLDAVHGVTTTVDVTSDAACSTCGGSGAEPGTLPTQCSRCHGSGAIAIDQGPFSVSEVCPTCGGRGQIIEHKCTSCRSTGVERRRREVKVRIPAGVRDRQRIRVKGRGAAGRNGGPPGDLYVVVHVGKHSVFGRASKNNLTVEVPITFAEAALGAHVKVPTLAAPVTVKVPAGTQHGSKVRVRGRGIAPVTGDPGDLLVTFAVVVPEKLTADQKDAVEALAEAIPTNPRLHFDL